MTDTDRVFNHAHAVLNDMNCPTALLDTIAAALAPSLRLIDNRVCVPDADGLPRVIPSMSGDGSLIDYPIARFVSESQRTNAALRW